MPGYMPSPYMNRPPMGYQPYTYSGFTKHSVKAAMKSFKMFDHNRSKTLSQYELQNFLNNVFAMNGQPPPNPQDVAYYLHKYDVNGDHQLSKKEVKRLLKELSGLKHYNQFGWKVHYKKKHKKHW